MPMRDDFATCPRCKTALDERPDRWSCGKCEGMQLSEETVSQLIAQMIGDQVSIYGWSGKVAEAQPLVFEDRPADDPLICPRCATTMEPKRLYALDVDRCAMHGVWFDREELANALSRAYKAGARTSTAGEKVFGLLLVTASLATYLLEFLYRRY